MSSSSQTREPDRPLSGTEDERQRSERRPDVVRKEHSGDGSGLKNRHDGLAEETRNPGLMYVHPCCMLQPGGLSLDLPTQGRSVWPPQRRRGGPAVDGEGVHGEPARERDEQLVSCGHARQQHWRNKGLSEQEHRGIVSFVLVVVGRGIIAANPHPRT